MAAQLHECCATRIEAAPASAAASAISATPPPDHRSLVWPMAPGVMQCAVVSAGISYAVAAELYSCSSEVGRPSPMIYTLSVVRMMPGYE